MATATMTSKGQITVPAEVRAKYRLQTGTRVDFVENAAGELILRPRKTGDIRDLKGIVKYDGPPLSIEDMDRAVGDVVTEDYRQSVS